MQTNDPWKIEAQIKNIYLNIKIELWLKLNSSIGQMNQISALNNPLGVDTPLHK